MLYRFVKEKFNKVIKRLCSMDDKLDQILAELGVSGDVDPMASRSGIDAVWTYTGIGNSFTLPNEVTYIYTFHRNGIEQDESQYDIVGTTLTVNPSLGTLTNGENEIIELRYKYMP